AAQRAHDSGEAERVAVPLFVSVERRLTAPRAADAGQPPRARDDRRVFALAVDAEVNAFELAQRVGQLGAVCLLAAVERGVAAEAEAGHGDAGAAARPAHVADELVAAAAQVRLQVYASVLLEVHAVVGEEDDLGLGACGLLYLAQDSIERSERAEELLGP